MRTNLAKLPYLLLAILVVGSTLFYAANTAATFDSFLNPNRARPPLGQSDNARFLVQPLPESRRAGMAAEDEPISVNGVPFTGMAGLIRQTFYAHPGQVFLHRLSQSIGRDAYRAGAVNGTAENPAQLHGTGSSTSCWLSSFRPSASCLAIGWYWPDRSNGMPGFCWAS